MLGEPLASRYEPSDSVTEDKYGRHTTGRRVQDGKPVVLSVLDPQLKAGVPEVVAVAETSRRLAEARLRSILHCLEAGRTDGGNLYVVFEAAGTDSLKALVRARNGLRLEAALIVARHIAAVLKAASDRGVHHLDLTSSNLFVDPETLHVRVARYGFSHLLPGYAPARRNEPFHGTAEYLAPEVCAGRAGDASADLYALGILMYEMVAGKPPFVSSSPSTTIKRQVYEKPLPLRVARPGIPGIEGYERVIARLLAKDPRGRPADAAETLADLEALRASLFPETVYEEEPLREAPVEVECSLQAEVKRQPAPAPEAREPESRETRVFTGLAAEVAQAATVAPPAAASPVERGVEVSRPTEAFDPSLVEAALREEAAHRAEAEAAPATTEQPTAAMPAVAEGGPTADDARESARKAAEWFVEGSEALPESVFPPEDEERKESRMFWVIVGAVAILLIVGAVVYFEGAKPPPVEPPPPVVVAPTRPVPPPPPAPVPPAAIPDPGPAVAAVPDPGPPPEPPPPPPPPSEPSPEEVKARQVADLLAAGRQAFEAGNLDKARKAVESALELDRRNAEGKALLADIRKAIRATEPRRPRAPAPPRPAPGDLTLKRTPPAPPPAPPPPPDEEAQARIKQHLRAGRDAYNRGDYQKAIQSYNQALQLDPNNALVKKLLDQARAKANP